uniref:Innexin n=1 Tax=Acrobeloides nanus TaxID=290746 RepID=A0A914CY59_9BILA
MKLPMIGGEYINKLFGSTTGKLKKLAKPLFRDGVGDLMDKGNLWIVPGFTLFAFAVLWTTKLSKIALEEATCKGASIYDFNGSKLEEDAQKHCQTAKRYYVLPDEPIPYDLHWREQRTVKNPEWILFFWAPIVFVMYVLARFIWTLLLDNQAFECCLTLAPLFLLLVVLPLMIGSGYRTYGIDVAKAWWEHREWKGVPLKPAIGSSTAPGQLPLIPRITYCDYHFVTMGNSHMLTYRCYLDANWHERTALFTWAMLVFLAFINFVNLFFWVLWAFRMCSRIKRKKWVMKKWLNQDGFAPGERKYMADFAETFKMGNILLFYYIEAHTDRTVASSFCTALFQQWLETRINEEAQPKDRVIMPIAEPTAPPMSVKKIGWELDGDDNTEAPESLPPSYCSRLQSEEPSALPRMYSIPRMYRYQFPRKTSYDSGRRRRSYYDRYDRVFKEVPEDPPKHSSSSEDVNKPQPETESSKHSASSENVKKQTAK